MWAVNEMIPYFFVAGHVHYAQYGLLYLRSMQELHGEVLEIFLKGEHDNATDRGCGMVYGQTCLSHLCVMGIGQVDS